MLHTCLVKPNIRQHFRAQKESLKALLFGQEFMRMLEWSHGGIAPLGLNIKNTGAAFGKVKKIEASRPRRYC